MKLKINKEHKKIDLSNLGKIINPNVTIGIGSFILTFTLFSGCQALENKSNTFYREPVVRDYKDSNVVNLKDILLNVRYDDENSKHDISAITYDDLKHITSATVSIEYDVDYSFLNYMTNTSKLNFMIFSFDYIDNLSAIDGHMFKSGIDITIRSFGYQTIDNSNFHFLKDIPSINTLNLHSVDSECLNVDSKFIQSLTNVKNLILDLGFSTPFEYTDLSFLKSLTVKKAGPYDICMYFKNSDLEKLEKAGVRLDMGDLNKVKQINDKISNIASSLGLNENSSELEKLNAILYYVLKNFKYNEFVKKIAQTDLTFPREITDSFYKDGILTAALEKDSQICGNYAAMTKMLAREVGLDAKVITSYNHVWNAVKVGDYYYYVDPTWLDNDITTFSTLKLGNSITGEFLTIENQYMNVLKLFEENDQNNMYKLNWYLEDPTEISYIDNTSTHKPIIDASEYDLRYIPDDEQIGKIRDISDEKFKITMGGNTFIIYGSALVGILYGLGIGKLSKYPIKTNEKEIENTKSR